MKKYFLLLLSMAMACSFLYAQEDELRLISSSHSRIDGTTGRMKHYRPVYEHKGSTLSADSGYIHSDAEERQLFDAYGQIVITQPNGTVVYADRLHYVVATQVATLTNNVRMVDDNSVLTTNHLTYNMKSGLGTYTSGGRIVNVTDTITSKNAYYFDNTKDAYFRHDVIVRTPDVKIYTDTMRYNSETKMNFFYGPTNIKGNGGENLYTESGDYNTESEQAKFGKNNLYTEGSRFLKGDSLYYDGKTGNGRAVKHVTFVDTTDHFFAYGDLGVYHKDDESITMTENPLIITVTRSDSTESDSIAMPVDSLASDVDSLTNAEPAGQDSLLSDSLAVPKKNGAVVDSIYLTADTLFSQVVPLKDYLPLKFDLDREGGEVEEFGDDMGEFSDDFGDLDLQRDPDDDPTGLDKADIGQDTTLLINDVDSVNQPLDSLRRVEADSLQLAVPESLRDTASSIIDSIAVSQKKTIEEHIIKQVPIKRVQYAPLSAGRELLERNLAADSVLRSKAVIPSGMEADSLIARAMEVSARTSTDSIPTDSLVSDTAKARIIKAYYNVRLFKSDLQAVADSMYYGYPDSLMRFHGKPMIWARGSQLASDTIYMQIKDEKLDNMLMVSNAFLVNTQLDSSKFNQIKGRRITGFFTNNELERLFVDGNAESIYYNINDERQVFTDMYHNRSSRIKILIDSNQITDFIPIKNVDGKVYPLNLVPQEAEVLNGFVWKPGDRPTSKEDLLARKRITGEHDLALPADSSANTASAPRDSSSIADDSLQLESPVMPTDSLELGKPQKPDRIMRDSSRRDSMLIAPELKRDSIKTVDTLSITDTIPRLDTISKVPESENMTGWRFKLPTVPNHRAIRIRGGKTNGFGENPPIYPRRSHGGLWYFSPPDPLRRTSYHIPKA